jgi:hypothetical protein
VEGAGGGLSVMDPDGHHDFGATDSFLASATGEVKKNVFWEIIYFFLIALRRIVSSPMKTPF